MSPGTGILIDPTKEKAGERPAYTPSPKDAKTIRVVNDAGDKVRRHKIPFEKQWFVNLAALQNQYWLAWNTVTRSWDIPLKGPGEGIRLSINMMLPFWRRAVARITAHPPALHVAPATSDEEDEEIARLNLKVIEGEFERLNIRSLQKRIAGWQFATGNVYVEVRWDPWEGQPLWQDIPVMAIDPFTGIEGPSLDPMTGEPITERVPLTDEKGRQLHEGQSVIDVFSPFECGSDPLAASFDESEWFYREPIRSLDWIKRHYEKGHLVEAEPDLYGDSQYEKLTKQLAGSQGTTTGEGDEDAGPIQDSARVKEYKQAPTLEHPEGRTIVVANKVLLWDDTNPYTEMLKNGIKINVVQIVEIAVNGRATGSSTIEHGVALNRALNRRRSQEEENTAVCGRPKVLIPKGSGVPEGAFNSKAGEKIPYTPINNQKPEPFRVDSMAMATDTAIRHLMADLQEVMSSHDATIGRMPSANAPAEAVRLLQVGDETILNESEGHNRDGWIKIAKMLLCNAHQFWGEERLVRVTGEDNAIQASKIAGYQLTGEGEGSYCDVRMVPQSTMWRDPKMQRDTVKELIALQILNPLENKREILKMLDLATLEPILKDHHQDEGWANKENELMEQGQALMPRDFENQNVHILQHDRYRKSERYRRLPPEIQAVFDQHVEMHKQFRVAKAQEEMAAQAAVSGAGMMPGAEGEPGAGPEGGGQEPGASAPGIEPEPTPPG